MSANPATNFKRAIEQRLNDCRRTLKHNLKLMYAVANNLVEDDEDDQQYSECQSDYESALQESAFLKGYCIGMSHNNPYVEIPDYICSSNEDETAKFIKNIYRTSLEIASLNPNHVNCMCPDECVVHNCHALQHINTIDDVDGDNGKL
jgi:hypothetical protein